MPRIALTRDQRDRQKWEAEDQAIRGAVGAYMMRSGRTLPEVAALCGIGRSTMYARMRAPETLSLGEYRKLMALVGAAE